MDPANVGRVAVRAPALAARRRRMRCASFACDPMLINQPFLRDNAVTTIYALGDTLTTLYTPKSRHRALVLRPRSRYPFEEPSRVDAAATTTPPPVSCRQRRRAEQALLRPRSRSTGVDLVLRRGLGPLARPCQRREQVDFDPYLLRRSPTLPWHVSIAGAPYAPRDPAASRRASTRGPPGIDTGRPAWHSVSQNLALDLLTDLAVGLIPRPLRMSRRHSRAYRHEDRSGPRPSSVHRPSQSRRSTAGLPYPALAQRPRLLILDEPTSVLSDL